MTLANLLEKSSYVISELTTEFVRRADECIRADGASRESACFLLALRCSSLLVGVRKVMLPETYDSFDVLMRSFLESRDLLITFRFNHEGTREKIGYWFKGKADNAWKADHRKCEEFFENIGAGKSELARRWSIMTTLSHPTYYAASNSARITESWVSRRPLEDNDKVMQSKVADYLVSIASLIVAATFDLPNWVSLKCDPVRMSNIDAFQDLVKEIAIPILNKTSNIDLPPGSFRE